MSTRCPADNPAISTKQTYAVRYAIGTDAAWVNVHPGGTATTMRSSVIAVGANALCGKRPMTASPGRALYIGGGVDDDSGGFAPQAFVVDAPSATTTSWKFRPAART